MSNSIRQMNGTLAGVLPVETAGAGASGKNVAGAKAEADVSALPTDAASLSPLGGALGSATRAAASLGSFRPELVAAIKSKIAAGSYKPDPNAVASRVALALKGMK
jgi:flagellar biosynthesis anti-sigma factor FlgM